MRSVEVNAKDPDHLFLETLDSDSEHILYEEGDSSFRAPKRQKLVCTDPKPNKFAALKGALNGVSSLFNPILKNRDDHTSRNIKEPLGNLNKPQQRGVLREPFAVPTQDHEDVESPPSLGTAGRSLRNGGTATDDLETGSANGGAEGHPSAASILKYSSHMLLDEPSLKRGRGRPRKDGLPPGSVKKTEAFPLLNGALESIASSEKKKRGRPRKRPATLTSYEAIEAAVSENDRPGITGPLENISQDNRAIDSQGYPSNLAPQISKSTADVQDPPAKRKRGRPRKQILPPSEDADSRSSPIAPRDPFINISKVNTSPDDAEVAGGRERRAPRRFAEEAIGTSERKAPSHVLIPTKNIKGRPKGRPKTPPIFAEQNGLDQMASSLEISFGVPAQDSTVVSMAGDEQDIKSKTMNMNMQARLSATPNSKGKKRGRPRKHPLAVPIFGLDREANTSGTQMDQVSELFQPAAATSHQESAEALTASRKRGRPRIHQLIPNQPDEANSDAYVLDSIDVDIDGETSLAEGILDYKSLFQRMRDDHLEGLNLKVGALRSFLLNRITQRERMRLVGVGEEYGKVHRLIEQTVAAGEGNSMLLIGSRGSGKTTLVETALENIATEHGEDFHIVRLNGFIHTDDKIALREIWKQLGREMDVEDDSMTKSYSYADTLSSLLALLSHPLEHAVESDHLSTEMETAKSVIFLLDEFELFTSHPRQTLLYNLFEIAQARKAPVAVLGLTARVDVVESLEKRVKSRFSHRVVHLPLPRTLDAYWNICKEGLIIREDDLGSRGECGSEGSKVAALNEGNPTDFLATWNASIESLYTQSQHFKRHLSRQFVQSRNVSSFYTSIYMTIVGLSSETLPLKISTMVSQPLQPPDSKLSLLSSLSTLSLTLLIAACRLEVILATDLINFNMAYSEYASLATRSKLISASSGALATGSANTGAGAGGRVWGKDVAGREWEGLVELGLVIEERTGGGGARGGKVAGRERMCRVDVGLEEVGAWISGVGGVSGLGRWCREI